MIVLACATTAWGLACSFETDPFMSPDARPDTADTSKTDSTTMGDSALDALDTRPMGDSVVVTETTSDAADAMDTRPEVDGGPPTVFPKCSVVGPPDSVCIPKVTFTLGAANPTACAPSGCPHEGPETSVTVNQFHIDEHEVTVKRFRAWMNASPIPWPAVNTVFFTTGSKDLKWRNSWPTAPTTPPTTGGCTWAGAMSDVNDDKPINCVDWFTALAFCMSEGKRLPTEAEWELAAGGDDRLFPWSEPGTEDDPYAEGDIDCFHALKGSCTPMTASPTSTVWGRSKYGVWNMAGSFSEWVLDAHSSSYGFSAGSIDPVNDPTTFVTNSRLTRGGSHLSTAGALRTAARSASTVPATSPDSQIGFRCAKRL